MQRMQRNRCFSRRSYLLAGLLASALLQVAVGARGDLIRPTPARGYPEIAGDVSGSQTYSFDPVTKTGTFHVVSSPHALGLGPASENMVPILPNADGTLEQSLRVVLDEKGRLVDLPSNTFQLRGTVVIGGKTFSGLLLEARPVSFGARNRSGTSGSPGMDAFDLDMKITSGELNKVFGPDVYLRIVPQADSTFRGEFTSDFSGERPLTDLRPNARAPRPHYAVPEPSTILIFLAGSLILMLGRLYRDTAF